MQLDLYRMGEFIRTHRKLKGISQKELCNEICTQSQLSKIENGEAEPLFSTIYYLAMRLDIDINELLEYGESERRDYIKNTYQMIEELMIAADYNSVFELISSEINNPLFKSHKHKKYFKWHLAICNYYRKKDLSASLIMLESVIDLKIMTTQDIEILNSIGVLYCEEQLLDKACEYFLMGIDYYNHIPGRSNKIIFIKLNYNYAVTLSRLKQYEKSLKICFQGIDFCKKNKLLFSLGEFHYHIGYNYSLIQNYTEAATYLHLALNVFKIEDAQPFINHVENKLKELNSYL